VTVTAGGEEAGDGDRRLRVPRLALVTPLLAALQDGLFKTAPSPELGDAFIRALQSFTVRARKGEEGTAADDQLVVAASLCVWHATRHVPGRRGGGAGQRQRYAETDTRILF
jgi:hypothetical protein